MATVTHYLHAGYVRGGGFLSTFEPTGIAKLNDADRQRNVVLMPNRNAVTTRVESD